MYVNNIIAWNNRISKYDILSSDEFLAYDRYDESTIKRLQKAYDKNGIEGLKELKNKYKKYSKLYQYINNQEAILI